MKKHIAQSGQQAGKWVNCTAKGECPIGGTHVTSLDLFNARVHYEQHGGKKVTNANDLPIDAVLSYITAPEAEQEEAQAELDERVRAKAAKRAPEPFDDAFINAGLEALERLNAKEEAHSPEFSYANVFDLTAALIYKKVPEGETVEPTVKDRINIAKLIQVLGLKDDEAFAFKISAEDLVSNLRSKSLGIPSSTIDEALNWSSSTLSFTRFLLGAKNKNKEEIYASVNDMYKHYADDITRWRNNKALAANKEAKKAQRADRTKKVLAFFGRS